MKKLSSIEQIIYSTAQIITTQHGGQKSASTGFFFALDNEDREKSIFLITNKHAVANAALLQFVLRAEDDEGNAIDTHSVDVTITDLKDKIIYHPDPNVDLCAIDSRQAISKLLAPPFFSYLTDDIVPTGETIKEFDAMEEIIMIGYPSSIRDDVNNRPIIRKGITASDPKINYKGKKEFLIDAACFHGSSGSPVFIYITKPYLNKETGQLIVGAQRLYLGGILHSGPMASVNGSFNLRGLNPPVTIKIPNNLGYIIKAELIKDLSEIYSSK
ncbi:serine protease [Runella sp. CRIBMP]|uniref:S1 family peptidase n=1 Tax=Runella sp. CRIBMP TaxID=2683261 RepID=UPI0014132C38|nr:serine protease [Runella sp. CRIBMP]NBB18861.1 serine protease [Runella sp. CRIBMP]